MYKMMCCSCKRQGVLLQDRFGSTRLWSVRNLQIGRGSVFSNALLQNRSDPFTFQSYHEAMRDPYDYYKFGQEYVRPLLDMRTSYFRNHARAEEIEHFLKKGHNVVMLSNHQTEADPAVIALLLEKTHPYIAEKITYIAGDRVVLDPFCKPFSMGRNFLSSCLHQMQH